MSCKLERPHLSIKLLSMLSTRILVNRCTKSFFHDKFLKPAILQRFKYSFDLNNKSNCCTLSNWSYSKLQPLNLQKISSRSSADKPNEQILSTKDKFKRAFAEYGITLVVFHVGISLVSLGVCYLLISSGVDMGKMLVPLGVNSSIAANTGTFVAAYAVHKVFAPARISITLASVPFIVRYLRKIKVLKPSTKT